MKCMADMSSIAFCGHGDKRELPGEAWALRVQVELEAVTGQIFHTTVFGVCLNSIRLEIDRLELASGGTHVCQTCKHGHRPKFDAACRSGEFASSLVKSL